MGDQKWRQEEVKENKTKRLSSIMGQMIMSKTEKPRSIMYMLVVYKYGGTHQKKLKELKIVVFGKVYSGTAFFLSEPGRTS